MSKKKPLTDRLFSTMLEWQQERRAADVDTAKAFDVIPSAYVKRKREATKAAEAREALAAASYAAVQVTEDTIAKEVAAAHRRIAEQNVDYYVALPVWERSYSLMFGMGQLKWYIGKPGKLLDAYGQPSRIYLCLHVGQGCGGTSVPFVFDTEQEALDWAAALSHGRELHERSVASGGLEKLIAAALAEHSP